MELRAYAIRFVLLASTVSVLMACGGSATPAPADTSGGAGDGTSTELPANQVADPEPVAPQNLGDGSPRRIGDNHYALSRACFEAGLSSPAGLARGARVVPSIENGQAVGFKLYAIRPGSLFAELGLQNGDTLRAVNGMNLTSAEKAIEAYQSIEDAPRLELSITRADQPLIIVIDILPGDPDAGCSAWPDESAENLEPDMAPPDTVSGDREPVEVAAVDDEPGAPRKVAEHHYAVSREYLDEVLAEPEKMMRGARVVPSIKHGKANGFKLYAIRPSSLYAKIGLTNGDTIHQVNGSNVAGDEDVSRLHEALGADDRIELSLTRRGKPVTLTVEIE